MSKERLTILSVAYPLAPLGPDAVGAGISDDQDILVDPQAPEAVLDELWAYLAERGERWDVCELENLRAESLLLHSPPLPWRAGEASQDAVRPVLSLGPPVSRLEEAVPRRLAREILQDAFARHLRGDNLMLVADLSEFPVGQAWIDLVKRRDDGGGYIWAVRVFPFLRNLGIGTLLMACAEDLLRQRGFRLVEVGVEKDNPDAHRLYQRLGYTVYRALKEEYGYTTPEGARRWHVVDQWILRKPLDVQASESGR